ncbi:MAG: DUF111 family protein, partial [Armatimonadota bacterium]|nr:DUF111 family protein [Armatimonadota bacterium]
AGARDVYLSPIQMKKNRPATLLSVLCDPHLASITLSIIFEETSTLGVRIQEVQRACLERTWETAQTNYGPIRIKIGSLGGRVINAAPEYEDCRNAAEAHKTPVKMVYEEALRVFKSS